MTKEMKMMFLTAALAAPLPSLAQVSDVELSDIEDKVVSADRLLSASFSNGTNPIGMVDKLVLDEDKQSLEYILLNSHSTISRLSGIDDGFVLFDQVDFEDQFFQETLVVLDEEEAPPSAPDELKLSRTEAEARLVGNILDEGLRFSDGLERDLTDILFDRATGEILYYVVSLDSDSLFDATQELIPADQVEIDAQGQAVASMELQQVLDVAGL